MEIRSITIYIVYIVINKLELQKAKLEISSYEEILKVMQEEICADSSTFKTTTTKWRKEMDTMHLHTDNTATNREWTQVSSKKQVKGFTKSDKCVTEIIDQLNMTSNRFTPLTKLCDQQVDLLNM
jgi:hypothetical protein